jgi:hypothetical protein
MKQKRNNSRAMIVGWHSDCLLNSTKYFNDKADSAIKELLNAYFGIADNKFRKIQIDAAIKSKKKSFDSESFMKKEKIAFLDKEYRRIRDIIVKADSYLKEEKVAQSPKKDVL